MPMHKCMSHHIVAATELNRKVFDCICMVTALSNILSCSVNQVKTCQPGCSDCFMRFCDDFGHWNPTEEPLDGRTQLMKSLMLACKKQPIRNEIVAGWKADMAVNAIFAAMIYHTPALNHALRIYGN